MGDGVKNDVLVEELMNQINALKEENKSLSEKICQLELEMKTKDYQRNMESKKHKTLMKELKKMAQEERRRAEALERSRESSTTPSLVIGDSSSYRSRSITDGQESVSSMGLTESGNVELINRIADIQRAHGEALHRITLLQSENFQLNKEIQEKSDVIEEWVRNRSLPPVHPRSLSSLSPRGFSGLRKFIGMTDSSPNQNDVMEMNRKLQRLLEETLSKNLHLQRDLQTLLERTDM